MVTTAIAQSSKGDHVALAAIVAVLGSVLVVRGVNLQGFVWWALVTILVGVLMEGKVRLSIPERLTYAPLVALLFTIACFGLYLVFGLRLSARPLEGHGVEIDEVVSRVRTLSVNFVFVLRGRVVLYFCNDYSGECRRRTFGALAHSG
jgi:hypothetical protein